MVFAVHFHTSGPSSFSWAKQTTKCSNISCTWKLQKVLHSKPSKGHKVVIQY